MKIELTNIEFKRPNGVYNYFVESLLVYLNGGGIIQKYTELLINGEYVGTVSPCDKDLIETLQLSIDAGIIKPEEHYIEDSYTITFRYDEMWYIITW